MSKTRDYKAEYQRRKQLGLERGFSVSQARGHANKNERSVSDVKRVAKETNTPIQRIQKLKLGRPVKIGITQEQENTGWRELEFNGFDFYSIRRLVNGFPARTRVWLIIQVTAEHYLTIYRGRSEGTKGEKYYLTIISNRTKFDFLELYTETLENEYAPFTIRSVIRFKPL